MIDTFGIYIDLKESFGEEPAKKMTRVIQRIYEELSQSVRRDDFLELKEVVKELAEAQKKTEERLESLSLKVEELAEAQKRTETRVEELAQAQKKTEERLESLSLKVEDLAEAQKRTEARIEELAQTQKKTEERLESLSLKVEDLAEAQKKTESVLAKLVASHRKTREQLGGLSHTVGYRLEDEAIWALPYLLKRDFGLEIVESLRRGYLEISPERYLEVNIWGDAHKNGTIIGILGEAKTQLKKKDVDKFVSLIKKVEKATGKEIFPVLITYQTSPRVQEAARKKGIKIYFSYELKV